jgi:hypothetical protein
MSSAMKIPNIAKMSVRMTTKTEKIVRTKTSVEKNK